MPTQISLSLTWYTSAGIGIITGSSKKTTHQFFINVSHGFPNSLVLFNLVCIEGDVLILHLNFEICDLTKILYSFCLYSTEILLHSGRAILFPQEQNHCTCSLKLTFQPGLKFHFDYMRFSQIFSPVWLAGQNSPHTCNQ